jgi:hypothetical protein
MLRSENNNLRTRIENEMIEKKNEGMGLEKELNQIKL